MEEYKTNQEEAPQRLTGQDVLAAIIAQFQILMPIALGGAAILILILFVMTRFWLK